ncbi:4396_t:CDS:2, partial [Gigaspora margarita]
VIFAVSKFEVSKNLQEQLKKAINHVNKSLEKLELKEVEKYRQKIDKKTQTEIDKYLPKWTEWIDSCTEITNKFNKFYKDL